MDSNDNKLRPAASFDPPGSIFEARMKISELTQAIQSTEGQLSQPGRFDSRTGKKMSPMEYSDWRSRAIRAMAHMAHEKRVLKAWLVMRRAPVTDSAHYRKMAEEGIDTLDPDQLLAYLTNFISSNYLYLDPKNHPADETESWVTKDLENLALVVLAAKAYLDSL